MTAANKRFYAMHTYAYKHARVCVNVIHDIKWRQDPGQRWTHSDDLTFARSGLTFVSVSDQIQTCRINLNTCRIMIVLPTIIFFRRQERKVQRVKMPSTGCTGTEMNSCRNDYEHRKTKATPQPTFSVVSSGFVVVVVVVCFVLLFPFYLKSTFDELLPSPEATVRRCSSVKINNPVCDSTTALISAWDESST